ncbi:MAG: Peptidase S8 and S53 subtilisin kexin sedolisin [Thermotogales bacterium 46_20]|nr:MAG: Peptidase S8 and S53 subtilisin kexin sedolisin [Thermotogales bacterium 46_20]
MKRVILFGSLILLLLMALTACPPGLRPIVAILGPEGYDIEPGDVLLEWAVDDPAGTDWVVDVFFGDDPEDLEKVVDSERVTSVLVDAEGNQTYYWKVVAKGSTGLETSSRLVSFTTWDPDKAAIIHLVSYTSGPPAIGVEVSVYDHDSGEVVGVFTSDGEGRVVLLLEEVPEYTDLKLRKHGYALSQVAGLMWERLSEKGFEVVIKPAELNPDPGTQSLPEVAVDFLSLDDTPLDITGKISQDFKVHVEAASENHMNIIYAALGYVPSAGFFGPRGYAPDSNTLDYTVTIDGYDGITEFHVVVYDYNDNRVHRVFYLDIKAPDVPEVDEYIPWVWSDFGDTNLDSYTRAQGLGFYSDDSFILRSPSERLSMVQDVTGMKEVDLNSYEPLAAPEDCNLWIDVWWVPWTAVQVGDAPQGYRIYRSFDGDNYELAGTALGSGTMNFRDKSAKLAPGQRVWYKVTSVYGGIESDAADLGSVIPLDAFNVELLSPAQGEIGTSRNPVFEWAPTKDLGTDDGDATYVYTIWIYDLVQSNNQIAPVEVIDGTAYIYYWETEGPETISVKFLGNQKDPETGLQWYRFSPDWYGNTLYPDPMLHKHRVYNWGIDVAFAEVVTSVSAAMSFAIDLRGFNPIPIEADLHARFTTGLFGDNNDEAEFSVPDFSLLFGDLDDREYFENVLIVGYEEREVIDSILALLDAEIRVDIPEIRAFSVEIPLSVKEAYGLLREARLSGLRYVEPSYVDYLIEPEIGRGSEIRALSDEEDPMRRHQWALDVVDAEDAWNYATGEGIVVAVIDTGVDGTHPDLAGQLVTGYNPLTGETFEPTENSDAQGHGTHVAGIIAAVKGNNEGIVGLAHNAKIMPVRIFGPDFVGRDKAAEGIVWAVNNGAHVLNNSWGGGGYSHLLSDAFNYALINGVVVVASAGNDHWVSDWDYPSGYTGVISVAASNARDEVAGFSSRGQRNSVAAPGVNIISTYPFAAIEGEQYVYMQGTSMAGPYVAALAALLKEKYPYASPYQIQRMMEMSAVDIDEPGWDSAAGHGRIDAAAAMLMNPSGINSGTLIVNVFNRDGSWELPGVYVSLARTDGRDYYGKTNQFGQVLFSNIDADNYDIIIGGPEHLDALAYNFRMQEELSFKTEGVYISGLHTINVNLESSFSVHLVGDNEDAEYLFEFWNLDTDESIFVPFVGSIEYDHPEDAEPGDYVIVVYILDGDTNEIGGYVTINGYQIDVYGEFDEGYAIVDDGFVPWWTIY